MALTLPSSNENSFYIINNNKNNDSGDNGQVSTQFNGGLTKTTATLTPTRLKNIEEQFLEHSSLPPKPFLHNHMAGFVPPTVNIKLNVQPSNYVPVIRNLDLVQQSSQPSSVEYYSSNSNSNDSFIIQQHNGSDGGYSSETNSSLAEGKKSSFLNSFSNFSQTQQSDSSLSGTINTKNTMRNTNNSAKKKTNNRGAATRNAPQTRSGSAMKSSQTKKSTGGGRKPNHSQNLTPEEELKRAKRRERNKIAAARCRKRRVDQTNQLMDETRQLRKKHDDLAKSIRSLLNEFYQKLNTIESHEKRCRKIQLSQDIISRLDVTALNAALEPVPDDDPENDLNAQYASSSQDDFPPIASPPPVKRKRPNSLSIAPMQFAVKTEPLDPGAPTISGGIVTGTTDSANHLTTPSNGLFDLTQLESTGLTPLNPTLTSVDLTPSTLAAFFKSIASPMDEQKKLLSM